MFGTVSMWITSFVKNINHFNFYFTGILSPMFFFSGAVFPLKNLPEVWQSVAEVIPLTHVVRMARAFCVPGQLGSYLWLDLFYCAIFTLAFAWLAVRGIKKRLID
jgi:lipooligosaccharide transport system permease protein